MPTDNEYQNAINKAKASTDLNEVVALARSASPYWVVRLLTESTHWSQENKPIENEENRAWYEKIFPLARVCDIRHLKFQNISGPQSRTIIPHSENRPHWHRFRISSNSMAVFFEGTGNNCKNTIKVYELPSLKVIAQLPLAKEGVPAISRDGELVAALGYDLGISLWSVSQQKELQRIPLPELDSNLYIEFSPDGKRLAFPANNGMWIWTIPDMIPIHFKFGGDRAGLRYFAWKDDTTMIAAGKTGQLFVISVEGPSAEIKENPHSEPLKALEISHDGNFMFTACAKSSRIWKLNPKPEVWLSRTTGQVLDCSASFSHDSKRLAVRTVSSNGRSGSADFATTIWDLSGSAPTDRAHPDLPGMKLAFDPSGKSLLTGTTIMQVQDNSPESPDLNFNDLLPDLHLPVSKGEQERKNRVVHAMQRNYFASNETAWLNLFLAVLDTATEGGAASSDDIARLRALNQDDFSNWNLAGASLTSKTQLVNCNLESACLREATLKDVNLSSTNLSGANFSDCNADNINVSNAKLSYASFVSAKVKFANMSGCNASGADFSSTSLSGSVQGANFIGAKFCGADIRHLTGSQFAGLEMQSADFSRANIANISFEKTNLEGVNFTQANLNGVKFINAVLKGADFSQANLSDCSFDGANLENCKFDDTILNSVNFKGAQNLNQDALPAQYRLFATLKTGTTNEAPGEDLSGSRLSHMRGTVDLSNTILRATHISSSEFTDGFFIRADLTDATLIDNQFRNCNMKGARLTNALIQSCKFIDCTFEEAQLTHAQLQNVEFSGCNFRNAKLKSLSMLQTTFTNNDMTGAALDEFLPFRTSMLSDDSEIDGDKDHPDLKLLRRLIQSSQGLVHSSESHHPYEFFLWPASAGELSAEQFLRKVGFVVPLSPTLAFQSVDKSDKQLQEMRRILKPLAQQFESAEFYQLRSSEHTVYQAICKTTSGEYVGFTQCIEPGSRKQVPAPPVPEVDASLQERFEQIKNHLNDSCPQDSSSQEEGPGRIECFVSSDRDELVKALMNISRLATTSGEFATPFREMNPSDYPTENSEKIKRWNEVARMLQVSLSNFRTWYLPSSTYDIYMLGETTNKNLIAIQTRVVWS